MPVDRSSVLFVALAAFLPSASGCLATSGVVQGQRAESSRRNVETKEVVVAALASERAVVRATFASADAQGVRMKVEQRPVCPEAVLFNDHFKAYHPPQAAVFVGTLLLDAALGAGAVWGVGALGVSNPDLSPNDVADQQNLALVAASGVVGAGLLAWIYPAIAGQRVLPRTEFRDVWCGEWSAIPASGWTVVTTTEAVTPTPVDSPEDWNPTSAEIEARKSQLELKAVAGLSRRVGTLEIDHLLTPEVGEAPAQPSAFKDGATGRHPWASLVSAGTPLSGTGVTWRVPAAALAPLAWTMLIRDAGGKMPAGVAVARSVLVVDAAHDVSGGATTLNLPEETLKSYAPAWACEGVDSPDVGKWLAAQPEDQAARAVQPVVAACAERAAKLKQASCERFAALADSRTGGRSLPAPAFVASLTQLCGPEDWNRAAWRVLDHHTGAAAWGQAQGVLDQFADLLAAFNPQRSVDEPGAASFADARRVVAEGKISSRIEGDLGEARRFSELAPLFAEHDAGFPARASWLATQRKAAAGIVATYMKSTFENEDWDTSRSHVVTFTSLMGEAWVTSMNAQIDKLEKAQNARIAAEERREEARQAAEERREEARQAAEARREAREEAAEERSGGGSRGSSSSSGGSSKCGQAVSFCKSQCARTSICATLEFCLNSCLDQNGLSVCPIPGLGNIPCRRY